MITPVREGSLESIQIILSASNLVLFFSLPFKPAGRRNLFFNGHIALALEGTVYQVYSPKLLKANFLFSRMPVQDWLFGEGGAWVDRDPASPRFTHVYLYGKCESSRTVVYCAGITVLSSDLRRVEERIDDYEKRFRSGEFAFNLLTDNCSSIVAAALESARLVEPHVGNRIPLHLFRNFVSGNAREREVRVGVAATYDRALFELHRLCIGAGLRHPKASVDRWIAAAARTPACVNLHRARWSPRRAATEVEL
jgi:hypothetical protein